jgi:hypothetical protein
MFVGSCFAEHFYQTFSRYHFQVNAGAHGILFHPSAIHRALQHVLHGELYISSQWIKSGDLYCSPHHHGRYNALTKEEATARANSALEAASNFLQQTNVLCITYGSSIGYKNITQDIIFANCHKLPQQDFIKTHTPLSELLAGANETIGALLSRFPHLHIICTVSPVRHWKDGAIQNQRSKAALHLMCDELERNFNRVSYFPAYELIMDDLRDYRFYKEDLLHPSPQAIEYIREKFFEAYVADHAVKCIEEMKPHILRTEHLPLHETEEQCKKRKAESQEAIRLIIKKYYPD